MGFCGGFCGGMSAQRSSGHDSELRFVLYWSQQPHSLHRQGCCRFLMQGIDCVQLVQILSLWSMRDCGALSSPSFALMIPMRPWRRKVMSGILGFCLQFLQLVVMCLIIVCFNKKRRWY